MASITRSYRIRAYPNGAQRRLLERWFGAARWLWNTALEIRSEAYRIFGLKLTGDDLSRWLTQWKREAGNGIEPVWNRRGSVSSAVKRRWVVADANKNTGVLANRSRSPRESGCCRCIGV